MKYILLFLILGFVSSQDPVSSTQDPLEKCWEEAFPNMTRVARVARVNAENELTCDVCTTIFQGLDDYLLNNEEQVIHIFEQVSEIQGLRLVN